jgi:predicted aldo/keto reductase-like oxidoreductase
MQIEEVQMSNSEMPTRTLGRTGVQVSLIGLGGWHLGFKSISDESAIRIIQYAMNLPTSVVITGCENMDDLEQALRAVRMFKPMTDEQVTNLLSKTKNAASHGEYELFKTTSIYDGTAVHPEWLGEEPPEVKRVMETS